MSEGMDDDLPHTRCDQTNGTELSNLSLQRDVEHHTMTGNGNADDHQENRFSHYTIAIAAEIQLSE